MASPPPPRTHTRTHAHKPCATPWHPLLPSGVTKANQINFRLTQWNPGGSPSREFATLRPTAAHCRPRVKSQLSFPLSRLLPVLYFSNIRWMEEGGGRTDLIEPPVLVSAYSAGHIHFGVQPHSWRLLQRPEDNAGSEMWKGEVNAYFERYHNYRHHPLRPKVCLESRCWEFSANTPQSLKAGFKRRRRGPWEPSNSCAGAMIP